MVCTYIPTVWRLAAFLIVPHFVKVVLVQLSDETGEIAVFEVLGEDILCEFFVLPPSESAQPSSIVGRIKLDIPPRPQSCHPQRSIVLPNCTRGPRAFCDNTGKYFIVVIAPSQPSAGIRDILV